MVICSVAECENEANRPGAARGLCNTHYSRLARTGVLKKNRPKICSFPGCDRGHGSFGWCAMHARRARKHGDPAALLVDPDPEARFYSNLDASGEHWLWTGRLTSTGYGAMTVNGKFTQAHRYSYEMHVGPLLPGLVIDHLCRVRHCVRPEHLEQVTQRMNALRGIGPSAQHALKTHCPQGHPYDDVNTRWYQGRRYCKACRQALNDRRGAERAARRSLVSTGAANSGIAT